MVFNSHFKPKPFWHSMFRYPEGAGRSQGAFAVQFTSPLPEPGGNPSLFAWCQASPGRGSHSCPGAQVRPGLAAALSHCGNARSESMALADEGLGPAWHSLWIPRPGRYLESCGWLSRNRLAGRVCVNFGAMLQLQSHCAQFIFQEMPRTSSPTCRRNIRCQVLTVLQNAVFYLG